VDFPCDTCKHINICSMDSNYKCSALFIFRQLSKESVRGKTNMVTLGHDTTKAYENNLQYVEQQYIKK